MESHRGYWTLHVVCKIIFIIVIGTQLIPVKSFNCRSFCNNCLRRPSHHNCYQLCIPPGLCGQQGKRAYELPTQEEPHPFASFEEASFHDTSMNRKPSNPLNAFLPHHPVPVESSQCVLDKMFLSYPPLVQAKIIEVFRDAEKTLQGMRDILDIENIFNNDASSL